MAAKTIMIQGTASHVGKSVVAAALCRLFARQGWRVAPFKAQNMSNNSAATPDGREIGRAQALQASACGLPPRVDFNPVLLKPEGDHRAQVVMNGRVAGTVTAGDFGRVRRDCAEAVRSAFARLSQEFDLIVLEGAGSPAEINLREHDIVNMWMAEVAKAPVLLVGDIDRGGVLAALVGTMALLDDHERRFVKGFVINKFRGEAALLSRGVDAVTARTGICCRGIIPYMPALALPQEDSVGWGVSVARPFDDTRLVIGVADVPCISNGTDIEPLAAEPDVQIKFLNEDTVLPLAALIFPGTKHTAAALRMVKARGLDRLARRVHAEGGLVIGLCGGYQLLGRRLLDPRRVESEDPDMMGMGLLDVVTTFVQEKRTRPVRARHRASGVSISGYEIHMGRTARADEVAPLLDIVDSDTGGWIPEGACSTDGRVWGTYVHGLFDSPGFRRVFLDRLHAGRGCPPLAGRAGPSLEDALDRWADHVGRHIEMAGVAAVVEAGV